MSTKVDPNGRRWVRVEVETPGSVEELWQAISTDAGLSAWFTRSIFEIGAEGQPERLIVHFGPGISSAATLTAWDPPRGFSVTKAMNSSAAASVRWQSRLGYIEEGAGIRALERSAQFYSSKATNTTAISRDGGGLPLAFFRYSSNLHDNRTAVARSSSCWGHVRRLPAWRKRRLTRLRAASGRETSPRRLGCVEFCRLSSIHCLTRLR